MKGVHCLTCFMKGVKFKYFSTLRWYSRVTEIGTKGLILVLRKQTQFYVSFVVPWWKQELSNIANLSVFKSLFVSILVCSPEPRVTTKGILSQEQAAEMGFLRRVQGVTLRGKMHRFEIRKARNVMPLFRFERSHLSGSAMFPESPRKDLRDKSCWLHRWESSREVQGPGRVTTSPTLLGPVLVCTEGNFLRLLLTVGYFGST